MTRLIHIFQHTILGIFPTDGTDIDDLIGTPMIQGVKFDQVLPPLILLLVNIAKSDTKARAMIKAAIMPDDM